MLKTIGLVIVAAIAAVLIYAGTRPDTFRVERSATMKAPPEKVFPLINDFKRWGEWSPWEKKDPAMKRTYSATTAGKGATYAWDGDKNVGQGSMEITESAPPGKVGLKIDFVKPFEGHNQIEFTLVPQGDATNVKWVMFGPSPFVSKLMGLVFNMDKMIGGDFETGLANMKAAAEK